MYEGYGESMVNPLSLGEATWYGERPGAGIGLRWANPVASYSRVIFYEPS